jgi:hypothetical protein
MTATNDGNVTLRNVSISDPPLGALSCLPTQPATLAPTQTLTCSGSRVVTNADFTAGALTNTAIVAGDPPAGPAGSITAQATVIVPGAGPAITDTRLALTACMIDETQDWTPVYTRLQFDVWNEDEVKFSGAAECAENWHETTFGTDFDSAQQNFGIDVLGTYAARYRVQAMAGAACSNAQATGLIAVQSMRVGPTHSSAGTTLAGAGKTNGFLRWDPAQDVPEGGIR